MQIDRRLFIFVGLALLAKLPVVRAQDFRCWDEFFVAYLIPLSGAFADTGENILSGARDAQEYLKGRGCDVDLTIIDTQGSVSNLFAGTERVIIRDNVKFIVAPFGGPIAQKLAAQFDNVIFVDLIQKGSDSGVHLPDNYVSLPYEEFLSYGAENRNEAHYSQGRAALEILAHAVSRVSQGSINLSAMLEERDIQTTVGDFVFTSSENTFELTK